MTHECKHRWEVSQYLRKPRRRQSEKNTTGERIINALETHLHTSLATNWASPIFQFPCANYVPQSKCRQLELQAFPLFHHREVKLHHEKMPVVKDPLQCRGFAFFGHYIFPEQQSKEVNAALCSCVMRHSCHCLPLKHERTLCQTQTLSKERKKTKKNKETKCFDGGRREWRK